MRKLVERNLKKLERSFVTANSANFRAVAEMTDPILRMIDLEYISHPEMRRSLRRCEDLAIALCSRISEAEPDEIEIGALRAETLQQLTIIRIIIQTRGAGPVIADHSEPNIENANNTSIGS